jgi:hypothetical protein
MGVRLFLDKKQAFLIENLIELLVFRNRFTCLF